MSNLFTDIFSFGLDCLHAYTSNKGKTVQPGETLAQLSHSGVPIETFIEMYDIRTYDFDNKCNDIKIMKAIDFEGAYILHNLQKDIYYIGVSAKVFKKIDRHFRGYGNATVYAEWCHGEKFTVKIVRLQESKFDNLGTLKNHLLSKYHAVAI